MICKNCTIAGRIAGEGTPNSEFRGTWEQQIAYWHGRCLAPTTCPCQHKLPEVPVG